MNLTTDPGLQPQRTALAWNRTALVMIVNALLVSRVGAQRAHALVLLAGAVLAAFALAFFFVGCHRQRELGGPELDAPSEAVMRLAATSGLVAALVGGWSMLA